MRVDAFDFSLAPESIALSPANPRDGARMLVVGPNGHLTDAHVRDLPDFLTFPDALVVNDTRVIPARLEGVRVRGEAAACDRDRRRLSAQSRFDDLVGIANGLAALDLVDILHA